MDGTKDPAWERPLAGSGGPDGRVGRLDARTAALRDFTAATLGRAETTDAVHLPPRPARDPELVQIHAEAGRFYQACLAGSWVPGYLAGRGLDAALLPASPWKIGYAPASWTILTEHLRKLGHCDAALLCSGLVVNGRNGLRDHFHDRLVIPLRAEDGVVVGFIGRRHPDAGDDHGPKYLNSPDTEIFTKGHILAGLAEAGNAFQRGAQPVLVEGPLDAIAVSIAAPGQYTGVAPCGTALAAAQVAALARAVAVAERGIRVALDGDAAGRKAAVRAYALLAPVTGSLVAVTFPDGRDPAETLEKDGRVPLRNTLTCSVRPLADVVVDTSMADWAHGRDLKFAELQMGALRAAAGAIAAMPADEIGPQAARLCAMFSEHYGWKPEEVTAEIINAIERYYQPASRANPLQEELYHPADSPWSVVARATAPSQSGTAADRPTVGFRHQLRFVQALSGAERGA
ncbi:MAG TPA: toprim domain-containing protein [Streptosporangiaceae bacterium]